MWCSSASRDDNMPCDDSRLSSELLCTCVHGMFRNTLSHWSLLIYLSGCSQHQMEFQICPSTFSSSRPAAPVGTGTAPWREVALTQRQDCFGHVL